MSHSALFQTISAPVLLHSVTSGQAGRKRIYFTILERIMAITAKTIRKKGNSVEHKILADEANFRLLSAFIHGMKGEAEKSLDFPCQVR
jgi:hypothetical protein